MGKPLRLVPRTGAEDAVMEEGLEEIRQMVLQIQALQKQGFETVRPLGEQIISGEITDQREIDRIMDLLMDFSDYTPSRELFLQCCDAIRKNDPDIADEYAEIYKTICSSDEDMDED